MFFGIGAHGDKIVESFTKRFLWVNVLDFQGQEKPNTKLGLNSYNESIYETKSPGSFCGCQETEKVQLFQLGKYV
jgi:hypothetical protein